MVFINPFPAMLGETEEKVISYFKNNEALSPESAINIDIEHFKKSLNFPEFIDENFSEFTFIKKANNNKYYLDESSLKSQTNLVKKIILIIFGIIFLISIMPLILYLFSLI